jgi:hypothetical protein
MEYVARKSIFLQLSSISSVFLFLCCLAKMGLFEWSIFQTMWNLGFDVTADASAIDALTEITDLSDAPIPFARVASPSQLIAVRKVIDAVEEKSVDDLSTEEKKLLQGLMFVELDETSSPQEWFSLAPSLLYVKVSSSANHLPDDFLDDLHLALKTSSVRGLSLALGSRSQWRSFFNLPSLRLVHWVTTFRIWRSSSCISTRRTNSFPT